jgi:hypothetical protein
MREAPEGQERASSEPSYAELLEEAGRVSRLCVPDKAGEAEPDRSPAGPEPARKRRETTVQVRDLGHGNTLQFAASSISLDGIAW